MAGINADRIAILQQAGISHRHSTHNDRPVGLQDLHLADLAIIVAGDFQQHIAAGAWSEKDVVLLQKSGIVGHEVFAFGGLEKEASAIGSGSQAEVVEVEFAVVVENDFVLQRGGDFAAGIQADAIQNGVHIFKRLHAHPESEGDLQA